MIYIIDPTLSVKPPICTIYCKIKPCYGVPY